MSEQQPSVLQPMISVSDINASLAWFEKLGFTTDYTVPLPDGSIGHAGMSRGPQVQIMLAPSPATVGSTGLELYIYAGEGVDACYAAATGAGIVAEGEPQDQFWGDRIFTVKHPDGYTIMFAQTVREVSPEEMAAAMAQPAGATA